MFFHDICDQCPDTFGCLLKLEGHGYKRERCNVASLVDCQMRHSEVIPKGGEKNEKDN